MQVKVSMHKGIYSCLDCKEKFLYVEKKRCVAEQMTALSSPTAVFLKESKGAYLSFPGETADTDTHTAQDFSWTLALSSSQCNENQPASAEYML